MQNTDLASDIVKYWWNTDFTEHISVLSSLEFILTFLQIIFKKITNFDYFQSEIWSREHGRPKEFISKKVCVKAGHLPT